MNAPAYAREGVTIWQGDALTVLRGLESASVHVVCTSPPYFALRSYLPDGHPDKAHEMGSERTPAEFVARLVAVMREVRRVLHPSGTAWINIGDSYAAAGYSNNTFAGAVQRDNGGRARHTVGSGMRPKDLCLIPQRLAIALQDDGWWVRSVITWAKKSAMPESVTDRPSNATEVVLLLARSERYFYDPLAVAEPAEEPERVRDDRIGGANGHTVRHSLGGMMTGSQTRNLRNWWLLGPENYPAAHFATFPSAIPRRAILAGSSERGCCSVCLAPWERVVERGEVLSTGGSKTGARARNLNVVSPNGQTAENAYNTGEFVQREHITTGWRPTCRHDAPTIPCTVLDPFAGSGTSLMIAKHLGRHAIGIELNQTYIDDHIIPRLRQGVLPLSLAAD